MTTTAEVHATSAIVTLQEQYKQLAALCDNSKATADSMKETRLTQSRAADQIAAVEEIRQLSLSADFLANVNSKSAQSALGSSRRAVVKAKEEYTAERISENEYRRLLHDWANDCAKMSCQKYMRSLVTESEKRAKLVKALVKQLSKLDARSFETVMEAVEKLRGSIPEADNSPLEIQLVNLA